MIRDLAEGRTRFCELERSLAGISPRTLSLRLRALEEQGIVERHTYPEVPPRVEYSLTAKGRALVPLIEDMRRYGREWLGVRRLRASRRAGRARSRLAAAGHSGAAPKPRRMRNRALHDALRDFALEAAALLTDDLKAGAEVEFDVVDEGGGRGPALYRYRPLTGAFIDGALGAAARAAGLRAGLPRARRRRLRLAARERPARRAGRAGAARDARAALRGRHELRLPGGALRARLRRGGADALPRRRARARDRAAPRRVDGRRAGGARRRPLARARRRARGPARAARSLLCVLERDVPADDPIPAEEAAARFAAVVTAHAAVGARRAWCSERPAGARPTTRAGSRWRSARRRGRAGRSGCCPPATSRPSASSSRRSTARSRRRTSPGRSAASRWAARQTTDAEALSDHLLGLRALLDATTATGDASFGLRLAALCAEEGVRREAQQRTEAAIALERCVMGDSSGAAARHGVPARAGHRGGGAPARPAPRRALRLPRRRPEGGRRRHPHRVTRRADRRDRGPRPARGARAAPRRRLPASSASPSPSR